MEEVEIKNLIIRDRQRKNFGNLGPLSESIKSYGVIQPIVVTEEPEGLVLVAGERRVRASIIAGRMSIPFIRRQDVDPLLKKELELEENLHRKDFSWPEEVELRSKIDAIKRERYGHAMKGGPSSGWGHQQTADSLGESRAKIVQDLKMAKFMKDHPKLKKDFSKLPKTAARRKIDMILRGENLLKTAGSGLGVEKFFLCTDALVGLKDLEDNSVDLILTDPPYGVESLQRYSYGRKQVAMFQLDNLISSEANALFDLAALDMYRVLKPGRHIYTFFSIDAYESFSTSLRDVGFIVNNYPIVWSKGKNQTGAMGINYMRSYETILFGYKPSKVASDLFILSASSNDLISFLPLTSKERNHGFEKPQSLLSFLIKQSSFKTELVLDPFAGVASTLRAAKTLERRFLGFELSKMHHSVGLDLLKKGQ